MIFTSRFSVIATESYRLSPAGKATPSGVRCAILGLLVSVLFPTGASMRLRCRKKSMMPHGSPIVDAADARDVKLIVAATALSGCYCNRRKSKENPRQSRAASCPMRRRGVWGAPCGGCFPGLVVFCFFLRRCSAVCAVFSGVFRPCWSCVVAVWLRAPGEPAGLPCSSSCPLRPWCSGGASSLVPGSARALSSGRVDELLFPPSVLSRRRVAWGWWRRAGLPVGCVLCGSRALPFPSVLWRAVRSGRVSAAGFFALVASRRRAYSLFLASLCRRPC